jgi:hypothetical protein
MAAVHQGAYLCAPMSRPKAALLEIYDSHEVNLYSQLRFLQEGGYDVTLIVSEKHRGTVAEFGGGFEVEYVSVTSKKGLKQWRELWQIRRIILERGIERVIFNTAHTNPVRNFCLLPFPKRVKFFGTLHGVNKLEGSFTQKIISRRIPNYFLLADYMLEKAMKVPHAGLRFSVFYPIFHPSFDWTFQEVKRPGQLWIAIPGSVEYKRRDYLSLVKAFAALDEKPDVRFFLLGNGNHPHGNGAALREEIKAAGLEDYFVFFDGYVPDEVLHAYVKNSDAIMPLIHPVNADMEKYLENQISGSFHLGFAYKKPLLMHKYFGRYQDFRETSLFYSLDELALFMNGLPAELSSFDTAQRFSNPKWSLDFQAKQYCSFLEA